VWLIKYIFSIIHTINNDIILNLYWCLILARFIGYRMYIASQLRTQYHLIFKAFIILVLNQLMMTRRKLDPKFILLMKSCIVKVSEMLYVYMWLASSFIKLILKSKIQVNVTIKCLSIIKRGKKNLLNYSLRPQIIWPFFVLTLRFLGEGCPCNPKFDRELNIIWPIIIPHHMLFTEGSFDFNFFWRKEGGFDFNINFMYN